LPWINEGNETIPVFFCDTHSFADAQSNLQKSLYQKQVLFDPFLLPDNSIVQKTAQSQNDWLPFNFNDKFTSKKISFLPIINRMSFIPIERQLYSDIPFFILIGSMRV
jgi:hypothetical protein